MMITNQINTGLRFIIFIGLCLNISQAFASYLVTDSFGKHKFEQPPVRIVVADWTLLEQLLELGVNPVGAPELDLYRHYVVQPDLPTGITDIGLRRAPNIEAIRALKPDVIILGTDQKKLARPFSRISRVMFYKSFSAKYRTNGKKSRERLLQLADLFKLREFAQQKLAARDAELLQIKQQIHDHFVGQLPKLTVIRFSSARKCLIYGENSIMSYTFKQLGIMPQLNSNRTKWGEREVSIDKLEQVAEGVLLYVEPVDSQEVFENKSWQSLPLVQQHRVAPMSAAWSYGGAMSVLYNARAIRDALIAMPMK